ncbi:MAG: 2-amino-4-hydroxy-6-hydroxymethyldihydropteridine diphosphokinase, partial [Myxococcales bacterium]|nr:2-amino-4-hydroxy-6-hydroxymethyldihydropteridine diphosphokinase [Myxococcales bacterium]
MIPSPRHPAEVEARVFIALGSNLGDRLANLRFALSALAADCAIAVAAVSRLYETAPVGGPAQQGRY